MKPYYTDATVTIYHGDCRDVLPTLEAVDTCITDPPYGLGFMGKKWDQPGALVEREADRSNTFDKVGGNHNPSDSVDRQRTRKAEGARFTDWVMTWAPVLRRAVKPGGLLLAFGGTRVWHRLAVGLEDAGWEIRDTLMWLYGSGFPKSLDVSKAIDREAGAEREVVDVKRSRFTNAPGNVLNVSRYGDTRPVDEDGYRLDVETAPATDAGRLWDGWGTALKPGWEPVIMAMNPTAGTFAQNALEHGVAGLNIEGARIQAPDGVPKFVHKAGNAKNTYGDGLHGSTFTGEVDYDTGRWPANVAIDEDVAAALEGAARFYYTAKASRADRGHGNDHPTVKPSDLMKWLCVLTSPPAGGVVLDPFMGSGTTIYAAKEVGRRAIGVELDERYCEIAANRCAQGVLPL